MQTNPEKYNQGMLKAARDIVATDGVGVLLAGLGNDLLFIGLPIGNLAALSFTFSLIGPTVVGYGFEGALKFGFYETFKKIFAHVTPYAFLNLLLASVVAGAVASVVLVSPTLAYPMVLIHYFSVQSVSIVSNGRSSY